VNEPARRGTVWVQRIEDWLLAILVLILVGLASAQIILRVFFDTGLAWADPFARTLVLWTGMLGALAAVRDDKHIALDILQRYFSPIAQRIARLLTLGFASLVCVAMAWYCLGLVSIDFAEGAQTGGSVWSGVRGCMAEAILPVAFALMGLRFVLRAFASHAHVPVLLHHPDGTSP
jgi:TRAP-type C4-dicarboxylate transport system permease small subunit